MGCILVASGGHQRTPVDIRNLVGYCCLSFPEGDKYRGYLRQWYENTGTLIKWIYGRMFPVPSDHVAMMVNNDPRRYSLAAKIPGFNNGFKSDSNEWNLSYMHAIVESLSACTLVLSWALNLMNNTSNRSVHTNTNTITYRHTQTHRTTVQTHTQTCTHTYTHNHTSHNHLTTPIASRHKHQCRLLFM